MAGHRYGQEVVKDEQIAVVQVGEEVQSLMGCRVEKVESVGAGSLASSMTVGPNAVIRSWVTRACRQQGHVGFGEVTVRHAGLPRRRWWWAWTFLCAHRG